MLPSDYSVSDGIMEEPRVFCRCVMGDCVKGIWFHGVIKNNQAWYCVPVLVSNTFSLKLGRKLIAVWLLSCLQLFATRWTASRQTSLSFTISQSLLKFMSIESVMPSNHLILLPPFLPALGLSQHQVLFQWVSSSHQVAKILLKLQHQSFQWIFGVDFLQDWLVWSPCSPRDS